LSESQFLRVHGRKLEYRYFDPPLAKPAAPVIVMLHEGLGSVSMWKDFPQRLASNTGCRVIAYSRFGYGRSDAPVRSYAALEMHEHEALEVLPQFLRELTLERPVLFGHSDGASIALIHAGVQPCDIAGLIVLAPHVFVEDMCIASIESAKQAYLTTDLPEKLARYHEDPDRAFWLWNNVWLDPAFHAWKIEHYLPRITCPVLAIQGEQDEYGTMEQLDRLVRGAPQAELLKLDQCRHSPHRDRPKEVLAATKQFFEQRVS
jgi:pimeloyl-ACP methyl ester carboxylesterase